MIKMKKKKKKETFRDQIHFLYNLSSNLFLIKSKALKNDQFKNHALLC